MKSNLYTSESGRSRASSYTSPKAFFPKQPQIVHNYKALSHEKLFKRDRPRDLNAYLPDMNEGSAPSKSDNIMEVNDFMDFSDKNTMENEVFFNMNTTNQLQESLQASKAYINAMKALQIRNKGLEDEKKELETQKITEKEAYEKQIKDLENLIKEKSSIFKSLENNLKEKLFVLEEENSSILNRNKMLENEHILVKEEKEKQQDNYNRSLRDCLAEKNELKTALKIIEDKMQYARQENETLTKEIHGFYSSKQKNEETILNLQEKVNLLQDNLNEKSLEYEREKEKIEEKFRKTDDYYEKLLEQELNEKQEIYRELNEIKGEYENLSSKYQEIQEALNESEKQNVILQEKIALLFKESSQAKQFVEYTQEINEKLINNFINESMSNINFSKLKNPDISAKSLMKSPKTIEMKKERLFTLENQEKRKNTQEIDYYEKKKIYKAEYEATLLAISELEKELNDLIQKYHFMSMKIVFFFLLFFFYFMVIYFYRT